MHSMDFSFYCVSIFLLSLCVRFYFLTHRIIGHIGSHRFPSPAVFLFDSRRGLHQELLWASHETPAMNFNRYNTSHTSL